MITTPRAVQAVAAGHSVARMALMVAVTVVMLVVSLTVWLVPTLGPPAAYTYLSVYVSEGAAPLQSNVVQFVQDDAVSCEYLSGGISSISQLKRRPMCDMRNSGGGYSEGRWLQSCQMDVNKVKSKPEAFAHYSRSYIPTERYEACFRSENEDVNLLKTSGLFFNYRPHSCDLLSFNNMLMAEMLRTRKMYFVGDSLTEQFVNSMKALTGTSPLFNKSYILVNHKTLRPMAGEDWLQCLDSERARMNAHLGTPYLKVAAQLNATATDVPWSCGALPDQYYSCMADVTRNQTQDLDSLPKHPDMCPTDEYRYAAKNTPGFLKQYHRNLNYQEWTQHLDDVELLFLGTGHHWWKEEDVALAEQHIDNATGRVPFQLYAKMMRGVFEYLRDNFKGRHIVFLLATRGHYDCQKVKEVGQEAEPGSRRADMFSWEKPIEAQRDIMDIAREVGIDNKLILLNVSMSEARPDNHPGRDCLHWCEPGVVDTWVHLAYNLFVQLGYANDARLP